MHGSPKVTMRFFAYSLTRFSRSGMRHILNRPRFISGHARLFCKRKTKLSFDPV